MWEWGLGRRSATASGALVPLVRTAGATWDRAGVASGLPVVRDGETSPRRRSPTGTPPGALGPTLRVLRTSRLEGVPETRFWG